MTILDRFSDEDMPPGQPPADDTPLVDVILKAEPATPLQVLVHEAAEGQRGAAWQLLHLLKENDSATLAVIDSLDDDRLAKHLLEWIALGTWASKPFVAPISLRSPSARMHLHTVFQLREDVTSLRAEHVLIAALHDDQPALRQTAANILGILRMKTAVPSLIEALHDPIDGASHTATQIQIVKALGRIRDPSAIPALFDCLQHADEQLSTQIFSSLAQIGPAAVPALMEMSKDSSVWLRWHSLRALGELRDLRALPVLVQALADTDQSVAWVAAKGLASFGQPSVGPVLRLLMFTELTPWLVDTTTYVLNKQRDNRLTPYIVPVIQQMHTVGFRVGTMLAAQKALTQLIADGLEEKSVIHT